MSSQKSVPLIAAAAGAAAFALTALLAQSAEPVESMAGEPTGTAQSDAAFIDAAADQAGVAAAHAWPLVRIYWPSRLTSEGSLPVVVYYENQASEPAREDRRSSARAVAEAAHAVVISVRADSAATAPADDGYAAYRWALSNASALGGDARHVAVMGASSSGGALARAVAIRARDERIQRPELQLVSWPPTGADAKR